MTTRIKTFMTIPVIGLLLAGFLFIPAVAMPLPERNDTLVVNSTLDNDDGECNASHCTLREAIHYAVSGDTIVFDASLSGQTILLGSELNIDKDLTIDASALAQRVDINGNQTVRLFIDRHIVHMKNIGVVNGNGGTWGAVYNQGTLTLEDCWIAENTGGASAGVTNIGTLTIKNCAFQNNDGYNAGAIFSYAGEVVITGSTFRNNSAFAADLCTSSGAVVTVTNSTFVEGINSTQSIQNSGTMTLLNVTIAQHPDRGLYNTNLGTLNYTNTLIAGNAGMDCYNLGGTIGVNSHNLVEDGSCGAALSGDPQLVSLGLYGGNTLTMPLMSSSPALDAGDAAACPATDQRGFSRPWDGNGDGDPGCDIGAVESHGVLLQFDGSYQLSGQDQVTFTFTANNPGPAPVVGATVSISFPSSITDVIWSCTGSGGVTCGSGTGDVADSPGNFVPGGSATYTITASNLRYLPFEVTGILGWMYDEHAEEKEVTLRRWINILLWILHKATP